ncbi:MAG TPA: site-2 protease family protein [Methanomassiliicoccales archaeon]|nr:site-2 protease family protein [Methanomassiliicoccales archaeon]
MAASLKVARLFGIPIYIHFSLLLILPLFAVIFALFSSPDFFYFRLNYASLPLDDVSKLLWGVVAAVIFFISILLHELAHSYVGIHRGYKISGITLFILGGVSQIEEMPEHAPGEALMAFIGPATSMVIGAILSPIAIFIGYSSSSVLVNAIAITISITGFYNLLLGAFNLVPAFPMDGGRVLRAELAKRENFLKATEQAAAIGKYLAIAMAIIGLFYNIWFIFIAIFIYMGADEELRVTRITESLRGYKVRDLMTKQVMTINIDASVEDLMQRMMAERHAGMPVLENGQPIGMAYLDDVLRIREAERPTTKVRQIVRRGVVTVAPGEDASEALKMMLSKQARRALVMDGSNLVGILSQTDLGRTVDIMMAKERAPRQR